MGWDEETAAYNRMKLEEEEELRRRAAENTPAPRGGTLLGPESGVQSFVDMIGRMGNYLGERGWGGTMPQPKPVPDPAVPMESGGTVPGPIEQWRQFVEMGGTQMKYKDGTSIKYNPPKSEAEKAQTRQAGGKPVQAGGQPAQVGSPPSPWAAMTPQVPPGPSVAEEDTKIMADQQARMVQQELARQNVGNLPYSPVIKQGEGPLTPMEEYKQRLALAEKERAERQSIISQGTRPRGEVLAEQYRNIAASTGKGMRIVMSTLNFINKGNPLWTDEMATLGAEHEQARQAIIMDRTLNASEKEYIIKKDAVDRLVTRQTNQRAEAKRILQERLALEPERTQDPRYLRDYLMAELNIAEKDIPQFLEDHKDPVTGKYNILKSPYEEMVITTKNNANALTELLPTLPPEIAIMAGKNQEVILRYFSDKEAQFNYRAGIAKTPEERARWEERRDVASANKNRLAADPKIWNLIQLTDLIKTMKAKGQTIPDKVYSDWAEAHKFAYGPSTERDPKKVYMDSYEQAERIKEHILNNELKTIQVATTKEKGQAAKNIVDDTIGTFPGRGELFRSKKATVDTLNDQYEFHNNVTRMAYEGKIPSGKEPAEQEIRSYMQHLRGKVETQLPSDLKKDLGTLSDKEVAYFTENIYKAQTSSPPQAPNLHYMAELIRRERAGKLGGKKK